MSKSLWSGSHTRGQECKVTTLKVYCTLGAVLALTVVDGHPNRMVKNLLNHPHSQWNIYVKDWKVEVPEWTKFYHPKQ